MPHTSIFYERFGLCPGYGSANEAQLRPMLAMADRKSKFCFWDLQKLIEGFDPAEEASAMAKRAAGRGRKPKKRGSTSELGLGRLTMGRDDSVASEGSSGTSFQPLILDLCCIHSILLTMTD